MRFVTYLQPGRCCLNYRFGRANKLDISPKMSRQPSLPLARSLAALQLLRPSPNMVCTEKSEYCRTPSVYCTVIRRRWLCLAGAAVFTVYRVWRAFDIVWNDESPRPLVNSVCRDFVNLRRIAVGPRLTHSVTAEAWLTFAQLIAQGCGGRGATHFTPTD